MSNINTYSAASAKDAVSLVNHGTISIKDTDGMILVVGLAPTSCAYDAASLCSYGIPDLLVTDIPRSEFIDYPEFCTECVHAMAKEEASASSPILDAPVTKVAFTGHRHLKYKDVESRLNKIHASHPGAVWITGGAVGLDSHAANYAMLHGIELWLILPFPPAVMTAKWSIPQKSFLDASIKYASKLSILSPIYNVRVYQDRNIRMVDLSDMLAAFWDGSPGGTGNCVGYARSVSHHIEMCLEGEASASSPINEVLADELIPRRRKEWTSLQK